MSLQFQKYDAEITIADQAGDKARMSFRIAALTIETAALTLDDVTTEVLALTNGKIVRRRLTALYEEDTAWVSDVDCEVENCASIEFRLKDSALPDGPIGNWGLLTIPAPKIGLFQGTSGKLKNQLNPAFAPLQTLLARYYGTVDYTLTTSDGQTALDPSISGNVKGGRIHKAASH